MLTYYLECLDHTDLLFAYQRWCIYLTSPGEKERLNHHQYRLTNTWLDALLQLFSDQLVDFQSLRETDNVDLDDAELLW